METIRNSGRVFIPVNFLILVSGDSTKITNKMPKLVKPARLQQLS